MQLILLPVPDDVFRYALNVEKGRSKIHGRPGSDFHNFFQGEGAAVLILFALLIFSVSIIAGRLNFSVRSPPDGALDKNTQRRKLVQFFKNCSEYFVLLTQGIIEV